MSIKRKRSFVCKHCNRKFDIEIYDSINANIDPELKKEVLNGDLYRYTCPHCNKINFISYPIVYHDMSDKYMIYSNSFEFIILENLNSPMENLKKDFNGLLKDYKIYGSVSSLELGTKISFLDVGLDLRLGFLTLSFLMYNINNAEAFKDEPFTDIYARLIGKKLMVCLDGPKGHMEQEFPLEIYVYFKKTIPNLDNIDDRYFNLESAETFLRANPEFIENEVEVLICDDEQIAASLLVYPFMEGQYKPGDRVNFFLENKLFAATVKKIIKMKEVELPFNPSEKPAALWKDKPYSINNDNDLEFITNDKLFKILDSSLSEREKISNLNDEEILDSICALGVTYKKGKLNVDELLAAEDENIKLEVNKDYITQEILDVEFLTVFLDNESLLIYKCNDFEVITIRELLNYFFSSTTRYRGLNFVYEGNSVFITKNSLQDIKYKRIMCYSKYMKELLKKLRKEEIEYIGEDYYNLICLIYSAKTPKMIAEEYNIDEDKIHKALDKGYEKLMKIVICNY